MTNDPKSLTVRLHWLAEAACPKCGEVNRPGKEMLIILEDDNTAYCNVCGAHWRPTL